MPNYRNIAALALDEMRQRSRNELYKTDPEAWLWDVLGRRWWSKQAEVGHSFVENPLTIVASCNGIGKDLSLDTKIPTPSGWTTMGDVQVGDEVFDECGCPTRVIAKSEVFHNDLYEVTFSDGARVTCSGTHEWNTISFDDTRRAPGRVDDWRDEWHYAKTRTTDEIRRTLKKVGKSQSWNNHSIPINGALECDSADLPIPPYVLGVWLGDGTSSGPIITLGEEKKFIVDRFKEFGVDLRCMASKPEKTGKPYSFTKQGYRGLLTELGVRNNKHIPTMYLRASRQQRIELLQGILDTDGFVVKSSKGGDSDTFGVDFMNEALAQGTAELIRTLGIRCSVTKDRIYLNGEDVGPRWRIIANATSSPFSPQSPKTARMTGNTGVQRSRKTQRTIVSVEPVETVPTQCIQVDAPSHLYLATEWMIPTHNSAIAGDLATWMCSVFPPEDTSVMLTAPVFSTIKKVVARYIGDNYMTARSNGFILPGRVVSDPAVRVDRKFGGSKDIIQAKRPADSNLISSFQGTHDKYVGLFIDEAGGVPTDLWTGAMAITTNEWAHILAIGNPDELNTGFYERMTQPERYQSWNRITISAYDSPNLTGEVVYPDDPAADADLKSKLVQKDWVEMMEREAHPDVVRAKVYGEFPESDDSSFFPPLTIRTALDTEIATDGLEERWLGVDLAWSGSDYTRAYLNVGGHVRQVEQFQYTDDYMEQARWIHRIAIKHGCTSVRVDASGGGKGIHSLLDRQEEFAGKPYQLIGFRGGERSPDNSRWAQARSWAYDFLRQEMALGHVDIDDDDVVLRDQLAKQTFSINKKGAIQITPKDEMRKAGLHSPDELDAVTMAVFDPDEFTSGDSQKLGASAESPLGGLDDFEWQGVLTSPGMVYAGDGLQSGVFLGVNNAV